MKRKIIALFLAASLTLSGCALASSEAETITESSAEEAEVQETESTEEAEAGEETSEDTVSEEEETNDLSELDALGEVEVEKELFDVVITIPADYVGETTQEELQAEADELGYTATLNEDGSATYVMTKSQHKEMMDGLVYVYGNVLHLRWKRS